MKKHDIFLWAIRLPLDFIIIFSTFFLAREIRLIDNFLLRPAKTITTDALFWFALFWSTLFVITFSIHWLYFIKNNSAKVQEFLKIILYSFYWFIFFSFFVYAWNGIIYKTEIPRLISWVTFLIWTVLIILERIILNQVEYFLTKKWYLSRKNILLINNKKYEEIKEIIKNIKLSKSYKIIWYSNSSKVENLIKIPYLWDFSKIQKKFENR